MILPSTTSIPLEAGCFGRPGMVMISPMRATMKPAPMDGLNSRTVTVKPCGRPRSEALSESEYWVLATQIGSLSHPFSSNVLICLLADGEYSTPSAP